MIAGRIAIPLRGGVLGPCRVRPPEAVAGNQLLGPVRETAFALAMPPAVRSAEVVLTKLGEGLGVISAAAIAFERLPVSKLPEADRPETPVTSVHG